MSIGIIINTCSIIFGGVFGGLLGHKLSNRLKREITLVFGICSMGNMSAVILAIVLGTILGLFFHFDEKINYISFLMKKIMDPVIQKKQTELSDEEFSAQLVTIIVLFCASGTGIYGSLDAGMTGDNTILISKSILDFFTAAIFACNLGYVVSIIAIPQFLIFSCLFLLAKVIFPHTTPVMIADFKACGGFLMLATGFRMIKLKMFPLQI